MKVKEQIAWLRTMAHDGVDCPGVVLYEPADTMEKLLAVYEAARKIKFVPDGVTDNTPIFVLRDAIAAVKTTDLIETVKERIADPKIVDVDIDDLCDWEDEGGTV